MFYKKDISRATSCLRITVSMIFIVRVPVAVVLPSDAVNVKTSVTSKSRQSITAIFPAMCKTFGEELSVKKDYVMHM